MIRALALLALLAGLPVGGAAAADASGAPVYVLPPPTPSAATWPIIRPPHPCLPGWSPGSDGICRRHAELEVVCDAAGGGCVALPPDPLPYGLGPYLRPDY